MGFKNEIKIKQVMAHNSASTVFKDQTSGDFFILFQEQLEPVYCKKENKVPSWFVERGPLKDLN